MSGEHDTLERTREKTFQEKGLELILNNSIWSDRHLLAAGFGFQEQESIGRLFALPEQYGCVNGVKMQKDATGEGMIDMYLVSFSGISYGQMQSLLRQEGFSQYRLIREESTPNRLVYISRTQNIVPKGTKIYVDLEQDSSARDLGREKLIEFSDLKEEELEEHGYTDKVQEFIGNIFRLEKHNAVNDVELCIYDEETPGSCYKLDLLEPTDELEMKRFLHKEFFPAPVQIEDYGDLCVFKYDIDGTRIYLEVGPKT